jgi:mannose-1-phosphate guanylyltransferase
VIGAGAVVGEAASVESSVIGAGAVVGARTHVIGSLVGERAEVGADCEIRGLSVVGPGARVGDRNMLDHGMRVAAEETIAAGAVSFP